MLSFITLLGAALVAANPLVLPGTGSGTVPDPVTIQISSVSASGNGCPQGSVTTSLSPDRQVFRPHEDISTISNSIRLSLSVSIRSRLTLGLVLA